MVHRYSPDLIPVRRSISPISLSLRIGLVRLTVELDEKHQVPREESTANQGGILVTPAVAKDWEAGGVLVCEMRVGGEVYYKEVEYELGNLHCRDVFLPLLRGCQMQSGGLRKRGGSNPNLCSSSGCVIVIVYAEELDER